MRVRANGGHLELAGERFPVHGVTYGSFLPRGDGLLFPDSGRLLTDLSEMADAGLNTVRTYTLPPSEVWDQLSSSGMRALVGLDYLDWRMEPAPGRKAQRRVLDSGRRAVEDAMKVCAGRSEVLAVSVGNEVPADIVRVHGIGAVEDVLSELVREIHAADPNMLVTYNNFPTTEYLDIGELDVVCFNVFLQDRDAFRRYLRHLQVASGPRPLLITELGLAADVHGSSAQAESIGWQLDVVDEVGCAGATVFAWTDEWGVGGQSVEGWGFGITDADRSPKPALDVVRRWAGREMKELRQEWPRVSVVVCAYNEQRTMEECLLSLERCDYPDLEVIVCDDGSTDPTLDIARRFPFMILELPHGGLSRARNAGIENATGEIIAFLDADAACHPQWPWYLALSFDDDAIHATGGPNLPFANAGFVERAVALSPGAPSEVLVTDDRAEHVPGCNMAFRRDAIIGVGAFDPVYTSAGDDVDVCWKILAADGQIGFSPAAQVVHHRRGSVRGYLRQQRGYGRAEKLLAGAHPQRFNRLGQARWSGFIYGGVGLLPKLLRPVVYHGYQGQAPFQAVRRRRAESATALATALVPMSVPIAVAGLPLALVSPWFLLMPVAAVLGLVGFWTAVASSVHVDRKEPRPLAMRCLVAYLHIAQPLVRTWGRMRARSPYVARPVPQWTGSRVAWLQDLEQELRSSASTVWIGGVEADWDIEVSTGPFCRRRLTTAVAWEWVPHIRHHTRVTTGLPFALAVAALFLLASVPVGTGMVAGVMLLASLEWFRTRRKVTAALAHALMVLQPR